MRLFLHMTVKNEADRYLASCLAWHYWAFDGMFVYDDQSEDSSPNLARSLGAIVAVRPDEVSSFVDNEGEFRQAAWEHFESVMKPSAGDWVLALDADEFLVSIHGEITSSMYRAAVAALEHKRTSVEIPIPEVFYVDAEGEPYTRHDGYWQGLSAPRFFAYAPGGQFKQVDMACGSAPTYADTSWSDACGLTILHYGYAAAADREIKHLRYQGRRGHNPSHVASIVQKGQLTPWKGPHPKVLTE